MKRTGFMAAIIQTFSMDGQHFAKGEVLNFRLDPDKTNTIWDDKRVIHNAPGFLFMVVSPKVKAENIKRYNHKKPTNK